MIKYSEYLYNEHNNSNLEHNKDEPGVKYLKCGLCDIGVIPPGIGSDTFYQDSLCNNCNARGKNIEECGFCYKFVDRRATVCPSCNATREIFGEERFETVIPPNKWLKGIFIFIFLSLITLIIANIFDNPWILLIGGLLTGIISRKFSYGKNYAFDIHVIPDSSDWYR
jgi:hypothetical protein